MLLGLHIETVNYPLENLATFEAESRIHESRLWYQLWDISPQALPNFMNDGYEDYPFYEKLQYMIDARSSSLSLTVYPTTTVSQDKLLFDYTIPSGRKLT